MPEKRFISGSMVASYMIYFIGVLLGPRLAVILAMLVLAWVFGVLQQPTTQDSGAVSAEAKFIAILGMVGGYITFLAEALPGPRMAIPLAIFVLASSIHIFTLPMAHYRMGLRLSPIVLGTEASCA